MYKYHQRCEVLYGHFAEFLATIDQCNAIARERGWVEFTPWTPTGGKINQIVLVSDYPDSATFEREQEASEADPEFMKAWRRGSEFLVQGSMQEETLRPSPHLA